MNPLRKLIHNYERPIDRVIKFSVFVISSAAGIAYMYLGIQTGNLYYLPAGFTSFVAAFLVLDRSVWYKRCNSLTKQINQLDSHMLTMESHTEYSLTESDGRSRRESNQT